MKKSSPVHIQHLDAILLAITQQDAMVDMVDVGDLHKRGMGRNGWFLLFRIELDLYWK